MGNPTIIILLYLFLSYMVASYTHIQLEKIAQRLQLTKRKSQPEVLRWVVIPFLFLFLVANGLDYTFRSDAKTFLCKMAKAEYRVSSKNGFAETLFGSNQSIDRTNEKAKDEMFKYCTYLEYVFN